MRICLLLAMFTTAASALWSAPSRPVDYVDPAIGSEGLGRVFIGPATPFGMVRPGPDCTPGEGRHNRDNRWPTLHRRDNPGGSRPQHHHGMGVRQIRFRILRNVGQRQLRQDQSRLYRQLRQRLDRQRNNPFLQLRQIRPSRRRQGDARAPLPIWAGPSTLVPCSKLPRNPLRMQWITTLIWLASLLWLQVTRHCCPL